METLPLLTVMSQSIMLSITPWRLSPCLPWCHSPSCYPLHHGDSPLAYRDVTVHHVIHYTMETLPLLTVMSQSIMLSITPWRLSPCLPWCHSPSCYPLHHGDSPLAYRDVTVHHVIHYTMETLPLLTVMSQSIMLSITPWRLSPCLPWCHSPSCYPLHHGDSPLAYRDVTVHDFNHYAMETPHNLILATPIVTLIPSTGTLCNDYCHKKWNQWPQFKSWTRLFDLTL